MHSSLRKICSIAAMLFLVLGLADIARATTSGFAGGKSWQIGDIIVCFGSGTCNVIRITSGGPVLLDQIFDSPQGQPLSPGVANPGNTRGVAINNTLHAVVTDDAGGGGSNVVVYSIASVSPLTGSTVPHTPLHVFDASGGSGSANAQTIAIGSNGHMFVGNAINGGAQASIVELSPTGSSLGSFLIPNVTTPAWVANNAYALNATVLDPNGHLQKVTTAGTSGPLFPPFNQFSGDTIDGLTWTDLGQAVANSAPDWAASTPYSAGTIIQDTLSFHRQQAATSGTSGTSRPGFSITGGTVTDNAVTWHDQGSPVNGPCIESQLNSLDLNGAGDAVYFTSGPGGIIQKVSTPISGSSSCTVFADFGPKVTLHGVRVVPPNSMPTNCSSSVTPNTTSCPNTNGGVLVVATGTQFVDETVGDLPGSGGGADLFEFSSGEDIQDICTGPPELTATPAPPGPSAPSDSCALLLDAGTGAIVARYPVASTTLQALTLDPLVAGCTGNACTTTPLPNRTLSNFWVGDSVSGNVFQVRFADGTFNNQFDANQACSSPPCGVTSIQGLGIYGGEGANQPGLARLLAPSSIDNTNPPTSNTKSASFLDNSEVVTVYGLAGPVNLALYASLVDPASCFNDQNAALSCRVTTSVANGAKPIVWKIDIPQGTADLTNLSSASIAAKYTSTVSGAIDNGTDAFTDMFYDTTVLVGNTDPGQFTKPSVQSLHEVPFTATGGAACAFSSPVDNTCYKSSRTTLPFTIPLCSGMSIADFSTLGLTAPAGGLSLVQTFGASQAFLPVDLSGTTGGATNRKASFRYDSSKNQWVYQLALSTLSNQGRIPGTFTGCAFDSTHKAQTFCVRNIKIQKSCP